MALKDAILRKEAVIPAGVSAVWEAWTTPAGVRTFFAPEARIDLAVGGRYEILFNLDAPVGQQGSEGMKVLSYLPLEMLSFSWNAPPHLPGPRAVPIIVVLLFNPEGENRTRVRLAHFGWGEGPDWEASYAYFDRAWSTVLKRLGERFTTGSRDWSKV